jgi:hypothetical protein
MSARRTVVPTLLHVPGARPLLVHHQRQDDTQHTDDEQDPPECDVVDEADVELDDAEDQDQADHHKDDAGADSHVLSLGLHATAVASRAGNALLVRGYPRDNLVNQEGVVKS